MAFGWKRFGNLDRAIVGGAGGAVIGGFLPWWGYSGPPNVYSASARGWSGSQVNLPKLPVGPAEPDGGRLIRR